MAELSNESNPTSVGETENALRTQEAKVTFDRFADMRRLAELDAKALKGKLIKGGESDLALLETLARESFNRHHPAHSVDDQDWKTYWARFARVFRDQAE